MGFWEGVSWATNFKESCSFGLIVSHGLLGRCFMDLLSFSCFFIRSVLFDGLLLSSMYFKKDLQFTFGMPLPFI